MRRAWIVGMSVALVSLMLSGCAKTAEEKEIKKSKEGITIRLEGEVYPSKKENILATMDGRVQTVYVKEGDKVKKGDLLVKFETTIKQYDIDKTQKELEYLTDFKRFLQNSRRHSVNLAMVNIARLNLEQISKLKSQGYSDTKELSNAKAAYASSLHRKYQESESRTEKIHQLDDRINLVKNELRKLKHELFLSEVRSDIPGFVADIKTQPGDYVNKGSVLGVIVNLDRVIVKAGIAPGLLPFIKKGKKVKIDFITTPPYHTEATITRVVMVVDPDFGRMTAEIEIPNKNYLLQEGTKALVTVYLDKKEQEFIKEHFIENPNKTVYEVKAQNY